MRHLPRLALLVSLWLLAWGRISVANLLSGIVAATVILAAFPPRQRPGHSVAVHPLGLLRLGAYVAGQLAISNAVMARQILTRHRQARPGVLAHELAEPSAEALTLMTSIISLSPGTMAVDVAPDASRVYVHFFDLRDVDANRASLARLDALVTRALSTTTTITPTATTPTAGDRRPAKGRP